MSWLRKLDRWFFGPPHRVEDVLATILLRLEISDHLCGSTSKDDEIPPETVPAEAPQPQPPEQALTPAEEPKDEPTENQQSS